ncbi:hypothetical protein B0G73_12761 [Paraburkholderia sp. BL25I1N1]|nr:hypothetical protein B0G73_12761 [Paraburkholderia sp. BL25I1N1]
MTLRHSSIESNVLSSSLGATQRFASKGCRETNVRNAGCAFPTISEMNRDTNGSCLAA